VIVRDFVQHASLTFKIVFTQRVVMYTCWITASNAADYTGYIQLH